VSSGAGTATSAPEPTATSASTATPDTADQEPTATPSPDDELAETGLGWGLVLLSGLGLGGLVIAARRLRMAS
jgi:hypothetical protein